MSHATSITGGWTTSACGYCGTLHRGWCPRVKAVEYHPDGTVKRVELHRPEPETGDVEDADG